MPFKSTSSVTHIVSLSGKELFGSENGCNDLSLWNLSRETPVFTAKSALASSASALFFSRSGQKIVWISGHGFAAIDLAAPSAPITPHGNVEAYPWCGSIAYGTDEVVSADYRDIMINPIRHLWTHRWNAHSFEHGPIGSVSVSQDGRWVLSLALDECKLFQVSGRTVKEFWSRTDPRAYPLSAISPGGSFAVLPDMNGRLRVLAIFSDRSSSGRIVKLSGHSDTVTAIRFLNDRLVATGAADAMVRIWDLITNRLVTELEIPHLPDQPTALEVGPNGRELLVGTARGVIHRVEILTAEAASTTAALRRRLSKPRSSTKSRSLQASPVSP